MKKHNLLIQISILLLSGFIFFLSPPSYAENQIITPTTKTLSVIINNGMFSGRGKDIKYIELNGNTYFALDITAAHFASGGQKVGTGQVLPVNRTYDDQFGYFSSPSKGSMIKSTAGKGAVILDHKNVPLISLHGINEQCKRLGTGTKTIENNIQIGILTYNEKDELTDVNATYKTLKITCTGYPPVGKMWAKVKREFIEYECTDQSKGFVIQGIGREHAFIKSTRNRQRDCVHPVAVDTSEKDKILSVTLQGPEWQ